MKGTLGKHRSDESPLIMAALKSIIGHPEGPAAGQASEARNRSWFEPIKSRTLSKAEWQGDHLRA